MKIVRHNIGEKVIALSNAASSKGQQRVKGKLYMVKAIMYCSGCGSQKINIGTSTISVNRIECTCGCVAPNNSLAWTRSQEFATPDQLEERIEEAVAEERYEDAHEFQQLK